MFNTRTVPSEGSLAVLSRAWQLWPVSCDLSFMQLDKNRAPRVAIMQHFFFLQEKYQCAEFFCDVSKTAKAVSCAAHGPNFHVCKRTNFYDSVFTAEAHGIRIVLHHIVQHQILKSVVYTDSLGVVSALCSSIRSRNHVIDLVSKACNRCNRKACFLVIGICLKS